MKQSQEVKVLNDTEACGFLCCGAIFRKEGTIRNRKKLFLNTCHNADNEIIGRIRCEGCSNIFILSLNLRRGKLLLKKD